MENNIYRTRVGNDSGYAGHIGDLGISGNGDQTEIALVNIFNKLSRECSFYSSSGQSMPEHLRALLDAIGAYTKYRDDIGVYIGAPGGEEESAAIFGNVYK